ncbi:TonB-dependent receptor [uncultured Maribacter sp.]|uniref:TonB-dependent receptor n=1 Tax=uncultured Maribacter sp. TaxID=431308 RepID=UPI0026123BD7|nr:TonB-dependent receptor [uncultured Maribacter sp.]
MKKISILLFALAISTITFAQNTYKGKVLGENNEALHGATIISSTKGGTSTNKKGLFSITLNNTPKVTVSYIGYKNASVTLNSESNIIKLQISEESLEEVVISASREQQKRKEVPAAISVISAKTIKETKAFGIEQIVNQVPGVFMATSKASSNEVHFMSVRSPISTKSLFLYVEDGLPIRPTAVFNHNALLEMNNTSFERVEVLKGPASSIYGSESIGGSFNFITKTPKPGLHGSVAFQANDMGLKKYETEISNHNNKNFGFYLGTHYIHREDGPIKHSDYEKFALTFKTINDFSKSLKWTNAITLVDFRTDMTGSLTESDYLGGNYESDQTFTERVALAFRYRSTLDKYWNDNNKTSFNFIYRDNRMDQIPSYRVRQFRNNGQLTGSASGETNSNQFVSYVGLIQHKLNFDFLNSSLIVGASVDLSPQDYVAEEISITVDTTTGQNLSYSKNSGDFILNYKADILNYAGYLQYEISPIEAIKITGALRYDKFIYDYDNRIEGQAGAQDSKSEYHNLSPKLGANFNFSNNVGIYLNYSNGFTPPQTSTLYRNSLVDIGGEIFDLKPSDYNNYEIGGYFINDTWKLDAALYLLNGKNTLITLRDPNDLFYNANAGKTRSMGIEYGITFKPTKEVSLIHNGSYANHKYVSFFEQGVDYSDTPMETAPKLLGISKVIYKPSFIKNFAISAEHELVGKYNTSFENQVDNGDGTFSTATYDGHNIINLKATYNYKSFEIWVHALNIFDDLYSVRASYNRFRDANRYIIGNPRAFHGGIKYSF